MDLAKKLWTDESFKKEAMKSINAGATIEGSIEIDPVEPEPVPAEPIGVIGVGKCGAGSSCGNHATLCSGTGTN